MIKHTAPLSWLKLILLTMLMQLSACASQPTEKLPELLGEANILISNGVEQYNLANYTKAMALFEQAMYIYRSIDNPSGIASAYINLAKTAITQHDLYRAQHWLTQTRAIVDAEQLNALQHHITIIESSIAIEKNELENAKVILNDLLDNSNKNIDTETRLAAVQNRTRIAFAENQDAQAWTTRYASLLSEDHPHAQARLARFQAALSTDPIEQEQHYRHALEFNRALAWRPGIAATLSEWAEQNIKRKNFAGAQNKLERTLLIRLDLQDNYNTVLVLQQLENVYASLNQPARQQRAIYWQQQISNPDFYDWDKVMKDFE